MTKVKTQYISIKPNHSDLQNYIAYYYFNYSEVEGFCKQFIFYPHYRNALTIYKNSKISFGAKSSHVTPDKNKDFEIIYTGIHLQSRTGKIEAPFNKIGIVFQALGINNFLKVPLNEVIIESPKSDFNYFGNDFNRSLETVYKTKCIDEKVNALDDFFIRELRVLKETRIIEAVNFLLNEDLTIQYLSEKLNISRKTLLRLFKKHLNCSPKEFHTLVKFRKALETYQYENPSLTDLAYSNGYYDQSDFIKHFKKVTGFNPKKFFDDLSHLGTEDTFWTVLNSK